MGGNARSGENAITAYPWGAHYLPFPTQESRAVRELLADFGAVSYTHLDVYKRQGRNTTRK